MSNTTTYWTFLSANGVLLEGLGLKDIALRRSDSLVAVEILKNSSIPILGGDVYFQHKGGIELAYANWYAERHDNELIDDYINRSCRETSAYIQAFPKHAEMEALFVLVVSEDKINR